MTVKIIKSEEEAKKAIIKAGETALFVIDGTNITLLVRSDSAGYRIYKKVIVE